MSKENTDLATSLVDSIKTDNIVELGGEIGEVTLDSFLSDGFIKDIPFFGTFYKGYKAIVGIREAIFAKKVYIFLKEFASVPTVKREAAIARLSKEENYKEKVGEKIIVILDQLDDIEKSRVIGKLFKHYLLQSISYDIFLKLSFIIQKAFLPDLDALKSGAYFNKRELEEQFVSLGLMTMKLKENSHEKYIRRYSLGDNADVSAIPPVINYQLSSLGSLLIKYALKDDLTQKN